jgi:hypothetical protein
LAKWIILGLHRTAGRFESRRELKRFRKIVNRETVARTYGKKPETGVSKRAYNRFFLTTAYAAGFEVGC